MIFVNYQYLIEKLNFETESVHLMIEYDQFISYN